MAAHKSQTDPIHWTDRPRTVRQAKTGRDAPRKAYSQTQSVSFLHPWAEPSSPCLPWNPPEYKREGNARRATNRWEQELWTSFPRTLTRCQRCSAVSLYWERVQDLDGSGHQSHWHTYEHPFTCRQYRTVGLLHEGRMTGAAESSGTVVV
jgi:hypothetical protein